MKNLFILFISLVLFLVFYYFDSLIETNYIWLVLFAVILPLVALNLGKRNDEKYEKNLKDNEIYLDSLFGKSSYPTLPSTRYLFFFPFKNVRYYRIAKQKNILIFLNQRPNLLENLPIKSTVFAFQCKNKLPDFTIKPKEGLEISPDIKFEDYKVLNFRYQIQSTNKNMVAEVKKNLAKKELLDFLEDTKNPRITIECSKNILFIYEKGNAIAPHKYKQKLDSYISLASCISDQSF